MQARVPQNLELQPRPPAWRRYGLALASTCIAAALRQSVSSHVGDTSASLPFAPAVAISAWYGGVGPGLFTTLLGALAADFLWLDPPYTLAIPNRGELVSLVLFVFTGVIISGLNEALHRYQQRTQSATLELVRSEQRFHQLVDGIRDYAIARLDPHGLVAQWLPGAERVTGYPAEAILGRSFLMLFRYREASRLNLEQAVIQARATGRFEWEGWHLRRGGDAFWGNSVITPLIEADGQEAGFTLVTRDMTAWKQVEEELRTSQSHLRELSTHLQLVREDERSRIAREIHDELGQSLSFLKMGLSWVKQELPPHATSTVDQLSSTLDESVRSVRRIAADLRPSVLDELGIAAAIEWHTKAFAAQSGIRCVLPEELPHLDLDAKRSTALYRILQEALTNVLRHSGAQRVRIALTVGGGVFSLTIEDDGCGIDPETLAASPGFGILGMRERALGMGGRLELSSPPEGGTRVVVEAPYPDAAAEESAVRIEDDPRHSG